MIWRKVSECGLYRQELAVHLFPPYLVEGRRFFFSSSHNPPLGLQYQDKFSLHFSSHSNPR